MLITRAQGAACRRAAERIAEGDVKRGYDIDWIVGDALEEIGWGINMENKFSKRADHQSQVLMALLWCATIAGE